MDPFDLLDPPRKPVSTALVRTVDGVDLIPDLPDGPNDFTAGAAPPPKRYRDDRGYFVKGCPAGPGRPPTLGWMIRQATADGLELIAWAIGVLRGEVKTVVSGVTRSGEFWREEIECSAALKFEMIKWLTERGFGKEVARFDVTSAGEKLGEGTAPEEAMDITQLSTQDLKDYLALRRKMLPRTVAAPEQPKPSSEVIDAEATGA